jgi:hypothetical protein
VWVALTPRIGLQLEAGARHHELGPELFGSLGIGALLER